MQSFVTLHENAPLTMAFIPCQRWYTEAVFHFVDFNGFNEMLIKGRTKVMTRCGLECVKVSFACRTLLFEGDVKASQTPSVLSLGQTANKWIKYGPSFLPQP